MATKIRIGKREFTVTMIDATADLGRPLYSLEGARGAKYLTSRNYHNAEFMFLVHAPGERGFGIPSDYKSTRLTDKSGELVAL